VRILRSRGTERGKIYKKRETEPKQRQKPQKRTETEKKDPARKQISKTALVSIHHTMLIRQGKKLEKTEGHHDSGTVRRKYNSKEIFLNKAVTQHFPDCRSLPKEGRDPPHSTAEEKDLGGEVSRNYLPAHS